MMEPILELLASRQPKGAEVQCQMSVKGRDDVRADLHYHTKGWVVHKAYQIIIEPPAVAIILRSFSIKPDS